MFAGWRSVAHKLETILGSYRGVAIVDGLDELEGTPSAAAPGSQSVATGDATTGAGAVR